MSEWQLIQWNAFGLEFFFAECFLASVLCAEFSISFLRLKRKPKTGKMKLRTRRQQEWHTDKPCSAKVIGSFGSLPYSLFVFDPLGQEEEEEEEEAPPPPDDQEEEEEEQRCSFSQDWSRAAVCHFPKRDAVGKPFPMRDAVHLMLCHHQSSGQSTKWPKALLWSQAALH